MRRRDQRERTCMGIAIVAILLERVLIIGAIRNRSS
jgi:hypothetical protein